MCYNPGEIACFLHGKKLLTKPMAFSTDGLMLSERSVVLWWGFIGNAKYFYNSY
jgi:hypothetical protein